MQQYIQSGLLAILALMGISFGFYEHQRVSLLETRLEIFQTYYFKNLEARVTSSDYQFKALSSLVDENMSLLTKVSQDVKRIYPGLHPGDLAEGVDQWSVFLARVYDAEKVQSKGDTLLARYLALSAFEGLGIFCHSRRLPLQAVLRVQPLVEDLYIFRPDERQSDWVIVSANRGC